MRCLILTDFIRKDSLVRPSKKLGAVPIFQTIKDQPVHIAVLTGSLIIVEKSLKDHIPGRSKPLDDRYVIIEPKDRQVHTVTRLFTEGRINVLIGTAALLGEGWDAPCINTLILASYVGSYMLSNQMRGRAIRTDSGKPKKTANIWHLVSVDASLRGAGTDFEVLHRRFRSFVGISSAGQTIESGITRLDLTPPPYFSLKVRSMNKQAIELSRKRDDLLERWNSSVLRPGAQMVQQVRTRKFRSPRSMIFRNTIRALFLQAVTWGTFFLDIYYNNAHRFSGEGFFIFSAVLLAITGIAFLPGAIRCLILTIRHHSLERSMMTLGLAVLEALCRDGEIWTKASKFEIKAIEDKRGYCHLHITGGTTYEKSVFLDALQDVLDPIMNPRYLIARKSAFMKEDYYSVPEKLSDNKKSAERFLEEWQGYVGPGKLVYTRTAEGRRTLLRARGNALSSNFRTKSQRVSVWT